jgi:hypothetical protein
MGAEVIWTKKAIKTFGDRIAYLEEHWTEKEIFNFTTRVNEYLRTLQTQPLMFRKSTKLKHTHIGVIIKQVSSCVPYKTKESNNRVNCFYR